MYKSREDEYQRRFDTGNSQSSYGYDNNNRAQYQKDTYEEDDFYGQIMRNASRTNPYRTPQEPRQEHPDYPNTAYEGAYQEPRRSRLDSTSRLTRIEDEPYSQPVYKEPVPERAPFQASSSAYPEEPYGQPAFAPQPEFSQPEYSQPVRAYERTSQFTSSQLQNTGNDFPATDNYHTGTLRETPSRRSRMQEESYIAREPQIASPYVNEETASMRRRSRPQEEVPPMASYGGFPEEHIEEPKKPPMTLSEEYESQRKQKKSKGKSKKVSRKEKQADLFTDEDTAKYKTFVKENIIILLVALVNMIAVTLVTASLIYTQVLKNYVMQSGMTNEIIKLCLLLAPLLAYTIAGLHCGYSMFKDKIKTMKSAFKILLSPILLIAFEVIGFVCEIPYLIYALVKMNDE